MVLKIKFEEIKEDEVAVKIYSSHKNGDIPIGDPNRYLYRSGDDLQIKLPEDIEIKIGTKRREVV